MLKFNKLELNKLNSLVGKYKVPFIPMLWPAVCLRGTSQSGWRPWRRASRGWRRTPRSSSRGTQRTRASTHSTRVTVLELTDNIKDF